MSVVKGLERGGKRTLVLQAMNSEFEQELDSSEFFKGRPRERFGDLYIFDLSKGEVDEASQYLRKRKLKGLYMAQFETAPREEPVIIRGPQYAVIETMRKEAPSVKVKLGVLPRELARVKNRPMKRRFDY